MSRLTEKQLEQLVPFMASLFQLSAVSKSKRRACSAGIVRWKQGVPTFVSTGVNGTEVGACNICENEDLTATLPHVTHAEINAMRNSYLPLFDTSVLLVTDSPCEFCLKEIAKHRIKHIVYCRPYRLIDHLKDFEFEYYEIPLETVRQHFKLCESRLDAIIS